MANLYEQYTQAGQKLPSVQERQPLAQQAGIQNYAGTAEQNTALGNYITTNKIDLSKPIKMADITGTSGTLPQEKPDNTNYAGIMSGIQGGLVSQAEQQAKAQEVKANEMEQVVKNYFGSDNQPSSEDLLAQTRQGLGITEKEQKVNDLTAQLNQIVAESQAGQLQQEGRLASMGAISGAQRDIERQTAIRALPIQAQLSAAQGNLQTAQSNLETLFKLKSEDAERKYNRESEIREFVYQYATDKEKKELDAQEKEADRKFEKDLADYKNELAMKSAEFEASLKGTGGPTGISSLTQAVIENPNLFSSLTSTDKSTVVSQLQSSGYDTTNLGTKPLSDTAVAKVTDTQKAISDLESLTTAIDENLQYIGPITGLSRLNPWSKANRLQADINRVKQTVGKALEGGVLRKEDEEKYKKILPTMNDTEDTVRYKLAQIKASIAADLERYTSLQQSSGRSMDVGSALKKKGAVVEGATTGGNSYTITKQ
jgi:hypothetical protein